MHRAPPAGLTDSSLGPLAAGSQLFPLPRARPATPGEALAGVPRWRPVGYRLG